MDPIKQRFYAERYEKENRNVSFFENFAPNSKARALTGKFYSRHDLPSSDEVPEEFLMLIDKRNYSTPKDTYDYKPPSANME